MRNRNTARLTAKRKGFTLVELLIVISIIALLASILLPSINVAINSAYVAKTRSTMESIRTAIIGYYKEQQYYPGQQGNPYATGSVLLAHAMFTNSSGEFPRSSSYMSYKSDMLEKISGVDYTVSDGFPHAMAICYYYSRGKGTGLSQFQWSDNSTYTGGSQTTFESAIKDTRYDGTSSTTPYGDGAYLLIAPGAGRKYFDGADDIMKW